MGPASTTRTDLLAPDQRRPRRSRRGWRLLFVVLTAFLAVSFTGAYGVRTIERTDVGRDGWTITVTYASVSRPGLATPWSVEIRHEGGFDVPVTLATTSRCFDLFDENGLDPAPDAETTTSETSCRPSSRPRRAT